MNALLETLLFGYHQPQEYLCVSDRLNDPFSIVLDDGDVSAQHLFLGYKPLVIGLRCERPRVALGFEYAQHRYATLELERRASLGPLHLYVGSRATHRLLPRPYQATRAWHYRLKRKNPGNVDLPGNLYEQVKLAYSYPRSIRIISLHQGELHNRFPTDLHGRVDAHDYAISLRIGGMACAQVEATGKLSLARVALDFFDRAYALGKNHMRPMSARDMWPPDATLSRRSGNLLPECVLSYLELERLESVDLGIHRVHRFRIAEEHRIGEDAVDGLAHIHGLYAQWRRRMEIPTACRLRRRR